MVARFDLRSGRVFSVGVRCAGCVALGVAGCSGESLVVGQERPRLDVREGDPEGPGSGNDIVPAPDVALVADCPPSPEERQALPGCWPTRWHLNRWRGFFTGVPRYETTDGAGAEFPTGDVLLELSVDGSGQVTFGAPQSGWAATGAPLSAPCDPPQTSPGCSEPGLLIAGYFYRLEGMELFDRELGPEPRIAGEPVPSLGERMEFEVRVGEPWDGWCADHAPASGSCAAGDCPGGNIRPAAYTASDASDDPPGCRCSATECVPDAPALSLSLRMSDDGGALRGTYTPNDATIGRAQLEFVMEPEP